MARKLLPNRVSIRVTPETVEALYTKLREFRALLPTTPVVMDAELATWEKMGDTRRKEIPPTVAILKEHGSFLPPVLNMEELEKDLALYDLIIEVTKTAQAMIDDLRRLQTIAGCEAVNVYRFAEEKAYSDAQFGVEDAIQAVNKIDKLPRSSDKKPSKMPKDIPKTGN